MESREKLREEHRNYRWLARTVLFALVTFLFGSFTARAQSFPSGFSRVTVATVYYPTAMTVAPDGRIFVCEKSGRVRIIQNGVIQSTGSPFLQVNVAQENERGLDGIVLDPNFSTNGYVYIYYTTATSPVHNRLSRFTASGNTAVGGETVLMDFEPVVNSIHNGGGMVFGNDGKLYLAMGDDHISSNAQDLTTHKGKILRLNKDGTTPGDNPYAGSSNPVTRRIWSYGLRNPYTLSVQPGTGRIFVGDVGEASWEEINDATQPGRNFGWPNAEGNSSNSAYTNPVFTYPHSGTGINGGCAVSGGTFFNPSATNYPAQYMGKYFFLDYCNNWINYLNLGTTPATKSGFGTNVGASNVVMAVGKDGNLYYFNISGSSIYKIVYSGSSAPVITQQPASQTVPQGQPVTFTVAASGTQPMSFQWQKNNVNITGATSASYSISSVQSSNAGQYRCVVSNSAGSATSNNATLTVGAFNAAPTATISAPVNNSLYTAGNVINFAGDATDPETGTLPASAFTWYVEFHHATHLHPGPDIPDGVKSGSFTIPTTGEVASNVWYRVVLVVTDPSGLKDTTYSDVYPRTSTLTLATQPAGLQLTYDGQPHPTPYSTTAVEGMQIPIGVVSPQTVNGVTYVFNHWVHGGAASQTITVPVDNTTYTAVFTQSTTTVPTSLIALGSSWRYLDNGSNQGTAWRGTSFSDTGWKTGNAELGYGDGGEATVVSYGSNSSQKYITTYFRKVFSVADKNAYSGLKLELLRDDGAVVYINGQEVYRTNMPGGTIAYTTRASTAISGTGETTFQVVNLGTAALVNGTNVIAVEIHQSDPTSSDISFNLKLTGIPASSSGNATFIAKHSSWKYLDNGSNQGIGWTSPSYSETGWKTGNAQLGYGDGDEATVVSYGTNSSQKYVTTYFRKTFSVTNASAYNALALQLLKDDGAVIYLNGHEIYRINMPGGSIAYNTYASAYVDGAAESAYNAATLSSQYLVSGTNVLAVEIHQSSGSSSDISFDMELTGTSSARLSAPEETDGIEGTEPGGDDEVFVNVFPNPSNGEFNISYTLGHEATTLLEVYDALGKRIFTLDNAARHSADTYRFSFSPAQLGLNSEVYFIKLTVDNKTYMTKLLYMK